MMGILVAMYFWQEQNVVHNRAVIVKHSLAPLATSLQRRLDDHTVITSFLRTATTGGFLVEAESTHSVVNFIFPLLLGIYGTGLTALPSALHASVTLYQNSGINMSVECSQTAAGYANMVRKTWVGTGGAQLHSWKVRSVANPAADRFESAFSQRDSSSLPAFGGDWLSAAVLDEIADRTPPTTRGTLLDVSTRDASHIALVTDGTVFGYTCVGVRLVLSWPPRDHTTSESFTKQSWQNQSFLVAAVPLRQIHDQIFGDSSLSNISAVHSAAFHAFLWNTATQRVYLYNHINMSLTEQTAEHYSVLASIISRDLATLQVKTSCVGNANGDGCLDTDGLSFFLGKATGWTFTTALNTTLFANYSANSSTFGHAELHDAILNSVRRYFALQQDYIHSLALAVESRLLSVISSIDAEGGTLERCVVPLAVAHPEIPVLIHATMPVDPAVHLNDVSVFSTLQASPLDAEDASIVTHSYLSPTTFREGSTIAFDAFTSPNPNTTTYYNYILPEEYATPFNTEDAPEWYSLAANLSSDAQFNYYTAPIVSGDVAALFQLKFPYASVTSYAALRFSLYTLSEALLSFAAAIPGARSAVVADDGSVIVSDRFRGSTPISTKIWADTDFAALTESAFQRLRGAFLFPTLCRSADEDSDSNSVTCERSNDTGAVLSASVRVDASGEFFRRQYDLTRVDQFSGGNWWLLLFLPRNTMSVTTSTRHLALDSILILGLISVLCNACYVVQSILSIVRLKRLMKAVADGDPEKVDPQLMELSSTTEVRDVQNAVLTVHKAMIAYKAFLPQAALADNELRARSKQQQESLADDEKVLLGEGERAAKKERDGESDAEEMATIDYYASHGNGFVPGGGAATSKQAGASTTLGKFQRKHSTIVTLELLHSAGHMQYLGAAGYGALHARLSEVFFACLAQFAAVPLATEADTWRAIWSGGRVVPILRMRVRSADHGTHQYGRPAVGVVAQLRAVPNDRVGDVRHRRCGQPRHDYTQGIRMLWGTPFSSKSRCMRPLRSSWRSTLPRWCCAASEASLRPTLCLAWLWLCKRRFNKRVAALLCVVSPLLSGDLTSTKPSNGYLLLDCLAHTTSSWGPVGPNLAISHSECLKAIDTREWEVATALCNEVESTLRAAGMEDHICFLQLKARVVSRGGTVTSIIRQSKTSSSVGSPSSARSTPPPATAQPAQPAPAQPAQSSPTQPLPLQYAV